MEIGIDYESLAIAYLDQGVSVVSGFSVTERLRHHGHGGSQGSV